MTRHLEAGVEPARKEETVSVAGTETVLLVEDEPAILDEGVQFIQKP